MKWLIHGQNIVKSLTNKGKRFGYLEQLSESIFMRRKTMKTEDVLFWCDATLVATIGCMILRWTY